MASDSLSSRLVELEKQRKEIEDKIGTMNTRPGIVRVGGPMDRSGSGSGGAGGARGRGGTGGTYSARDRLGARPGGGNNIYGPGGNPRTEIIVRQRQGRPESDWFGGESESGQPHRSCLTDEPFGFSWLTGLGGSKPCECVPSDRLNCDATSG